MKIIDGKNAVLGRVASYAAKELLRGERVIILNCKEIIITGNKKRIKEDFETKRGRYGSSQKGPIHSRESDRIVKRAIRGMLPNYREGRGREAWKRVRCHSGEPEEFKDKEKITLSKKVIKSARIKEI